MGDDTTVTDRRGDTSSSEHRDATQVVKRYESLVFKVAHRLKQNLPEEIDVDDLVSWGYAGLLEAYARYDEAKSSRFATFAYYRIRGAILDACPEPILDPKRKRVEIGCNEVLNTYAHVVDAQGDQATIEDRLSMLSDVSGSLLMVYVLNECPERALGPDGGPQHEETARRQLGEKVREILETLPANEQKVIAGVYFRGESLTEVGERMGYSPSWVSRIHARAMDRLRDLIEERDDVDEFRHAISV